MNFMKKRYKNSGKSVYQIAKEMGIDQNKVKEAINDERPLEGKHFDDYVKATEKKTSQDTIEYMEILQWYKDTDIKSLRASWGYMSGEVAKKLNIPPSTYSHIETKRVSPQSEYIPIVYDFFHDNININYVNGRIPYINPNVGRNVKDINSEQLSLDLSVPKKPKKTRKTKKANQSKRAKITNKEFKEMVRFFENDLSDLLKKYNIDRKELAKELKIDHSYFSWCIHHAHEFSKPTEKMQKVVNYFKKLENTKGPSELTNYYQILDSTDYTKNEPVDENNVKEINETFNNANSLLEEVNTNDSITVGVDNNDSITVEPHSFKHFGEEENKAVRTIIKENSTPLFVYDYNPDALIDEDKTIEEILISSANKLFKAQNNSDLDLEIKRTDALINLSKAIKDLKGGN